MVLNGDILEYENMVGEQGTNAAGITEGVEWLIFYLQMMVGPPLLRLNGGAGELALRRGMDLEAPYISAEDLVSGFKEVAQYYEQGSQFVGELANAGRRAATSAQQTLEGMVGWVKDKRKKRKTRNSTAPVYNSTNSTNMTDTTHGGPGAIISYKESMRFAVNTVFSTNNYYHARCSPPTWTDGSKNASRSAGYGQPLYMIMDTDFTNTTGLAHPNLPLVGATNTLENLEGHCFAIEWPGLRFHEDPDTNNVGKLSVFSKWKGLTTTTLSKTQNISFAAVMTNPQWKKMIVTNTFLRFDFINYSVYDHRIHIIIYTNKRKGIKYSEEFIQWVNLFDDDTEADAIINYDFFVNGKLLLPPPCKIIQHRSFVLKSAFGERPIQWGPFQKELYNHGIGAVTKPAQRRTVKMKFKKGFTFKRDNLQTLPTDEDVWLESTAVPEEQMTYCQVVAVPYFPNRLITQLYPNQCYDGTTFKKEYSSVAENTTWNQVFVEQYTMNKTGADNARIPCPGIDMFMRKKTYFMLDKDISLS